MTIRASALAAQALREFLLATLPAKVAAINLTRAATLTTPAVGPFTIPAAASLSLSLDGTTFTACALTAGSRTAAQCATEIDTAMGADVASALTDGRLRLTSTTTPTGPSTVSSIFLAADATGAAAALGWDSGGESVTRSPLVTPTDKGVLDGEPNGQFDPYANGRMLVVIRDRQDDEVQLRRDERVATMEVLVYVPLSTQERHASREEISAACECLLDALHTTSGRTFGHISTTDTAIGFTQVKQVKISGSSWGVKDTPNFLMDIARLVVTARVFQRASLT